MRMFLCNLVTGRMMATMWLWRAVLFGTLASVFSSIATDEMRRFEISYENDTFLMNGEPFRYVSGSIHYFRVPHQYWKDRLRKIKLLGFNAISTYVEWSLHEPSKGSFNFDGDANIVQFIKLAEEEGLSVILRPGPYICAEREFGGYPAWLLSENPWMKLRTSDPSHTFFISKWFHELFKRITPLLYGNGGPIILVQVENEYGSYPKRDLQYLKWLRDLFINYVGEKAVLFTTDGWSLQAVTRGKIPSVFSTVDFGTTRENVTLLFSPLRSIQPHGPLVNSEFYTGWLSYWGNPLSRVNTSNIVDTMSSLLAANVSFNCYMIHGGTNFGFTSGSDSSDALKLDLTSYDYDAPISEAGDLTDKYFAIRNLMEEIGAAMVGTELIACLQQGMPVGTDEEVEQLKMAPKGDYGKVRLEPVVSLLDSPIGTRPVTTQYPLTMELFNQSYGFIAYTHVIEGTLKDPSVLQVNVRDRALVLLNKEEISVLAYTVINETPLPTNVEPGMNITLLVENEGRRNYQFLSDVTKGIVSNATIDGKIVENWSTVSYSLTTDDIRVIESLAANRFHQSKKHLFPVFLTTNYTLPEVLVEKVTEVEVKEEELEALASQTTTTIDNGPTTEQIFLLSETSTAKSVQGEDTNGDDKDIAENEMSRAKREVKSCLIDGHPCDTYLDMTGWGKGVVFINGHNLGRYWHIGPQRTLYVPGVWLNSPPLVNTITIMELHFTHPHKTVQFVTHPKFDCDTPSVHLLS